MKKLSNLFCKFPILMTITISVIAAFLILICICVIRISDLYYLFSSFNEVTVSMFILIIVILPIILTVENIAFFVLKPKLDNVEEIIKKIEVFGVTLGILYSWLYLSMSSIEFLDWNVQLYNEQHHTPVATEALPTIIVIAAVALIGYLYLRFVTLCKQPPLMTVLGIAAMYLGAAECFVWCIQIWTDSEFYLLCLFPFNCILIIARTIRCLVYQKLEITNEQVETYKYGRILKLMSNASNWPWLALLASIPLLGFIVAILTLFGQEPDNIIKAWTQTADWNLSQKIAPQNVIKDEHYLCTVAAGGHESIVKPIRTGKRHGHEVIVNRQLCVANAFEQLLEERIPKFHRFIRKLYDSLGYPIAKHIHSPYVADTIYFVMKPLEWIFLAVLYLFDINPENRIAIQYPHSEAPIIK